jgi:hypothetical protein
VGITCIALFALFFLTSTENIVKKYQIIYAALMRWPERETLVCTGVNKNTVKKKALELLREEYGRGPVYRMGAMCSAPIIGDDVDVVAIPFFE